ncbi:MAG: hypothetical protein IMZ62_18515 [Chloroflexi bacterium]|nr:hypothetical protein [Chloroflexota bacterium]
MPIFTENDKAMIRQIAVEVCTVFTKQLEELITEQIEMHTLKCPLKKFVWIGVGLGIAGVVLGIKTLPDIVKWFSA